MNPVGYVVGEVRTDEFTFVTNREIAPPRLEYIVVQVEEPEHKKKLEVLAQVTSLSVSSRLLNTTLSYPEVESILNRMASSQPIVVGTAKVLGYLEGRAVRFPRHATMPGNKVELAPDDLLRRFFSESVDSGINIGTLINREQVPVLLNPNGLRRHLAVIAQTGAGKSYTVGVILEKLLELGGTVVVFDPNSDYVLMRRNQKKRPTQFANRVDIFRLPTMQAGRIPDDEIGGSKKFTINFAALEVDEICSMCGISETSSNIRKALLTAHDNLHRVMNDYSPHDFLMELHRIANGGNGAEPKAKQDATPRGPQIVNPSIGDAEEFSREFHRAASAKANIDLDWDDLGKEDDGEEQKEEKQAAVPSKAGGDGASFSLDAISGAQKATKYVERLARADVWGYEDVPIDDLLRPMNLSVIDLAGVDNWIAEFVVDKVMRQAWGQATANGLAHPVFFVLEEAHNFVPGGQGARSQAATVIKRIASEGRKFGVFLTLITQRPYKVHADTLSQCNSQIIMRLTNPQDQQAIKLSSESISEGLLSDLPGLNVGEAVVLGPIVRVPVMVRIGERISREGGNDIDVVKALEIARSAAITDRREQDHKEQKKQAPRTEWLEELDA